MKSINTTSTTAALAAAPQTIEIIVNRNHSTTPADALAFIGGQATYSGYGDGIDIESDYDYQYRVTSDEDLIEEAEDDLVDAIARHLGTNPDEADVTVEHKVDFTPGFRGASLEVIVDGEIIDLDRYEIDFTPMELVESAPRYLDDRQWDDLKSESGFAKVVQEMDADSEVDGEALAALLADEDVEMPENEFGTELLISDEQVADFYNMVNAHREADRRTAKELKAALKALGEEQLADLADLDADEKIALRVVNLNDSHEAEFTVAEARETIEDTGWIDHRDVYDSLGSLSCMENMRRDLGNWRNAILDADNDETNKELTLRLLQMGHHGWTTDYDAGGNTKRIFLVPAIF